MAVTTRKPKADQVYVCWESFGSTDPLGGCARGVRLLGSHEKVKRWPQFFVADGTSDEVIHEMRCRLYEASGAPPPD
jgi:hypothetical protein